MATHPVTPVGAAVRRREVIASVVRALLTTAAMVWVYFELPFDHRTSLTSVALLACGLAVFVGLLAWQVRSVIHSQQPRLRALEALATAVPFFILLFASTYLLIAHGDGQAFSEPFTRLDALYFTVTVFATVGFGDIVARSETARAFVTVQMVGDLIVIGLGVRLVISAVQVGLVRRAQEAQPAELDAEPTNEITRTG
jgi:voltage-gated potassium channel